MGSNTHFFLFVSCFSSRGDCIDFLISLGLILGIVAGILFFIWFIEEKIAQWEKKRYCTNYGEILYSDLHRNAKTIISKKFQLAGKPDYLIKTKSGLVFPVEIKTGQHEKPLKHHAMQLIAYCQLVEESRGTYVPYGILLYHDTGLQFRIPFNEKNRLELESTIHQMNKSLEMGKIKINHEDSHRCRHCSVRIFCQKTLI